VQFLSILSKTQKNEAELDGSQFLSFFLFICEFKIKIETCFFGIFFSGFFKIMFDLGPGL
jgi:hypothetical protein